jgi:hypothetical protein
MSVLNQITTGSPANNPLHRTGESTGRAVSAPSAMFVRIGCCGAYVRPPVSRARWPALNGHYTIFYKGEQ